MPSYRPRPPDAIDAAARTVIARKGVLAATIADIAAEAGRSTASFYNYYDSKEAMVREWAPRFRDKPTSGRRPLSAMAYPTGSERSRLRQCIGTPIETGWRR